MPGTTIPATNAIGPRTGATPRLIAAATGGIQLDSINVIARAHLLTLWSRFGVYDPQALDRLICRLV